MSNLISDRTFLRECDRLYIALLLTDRLDIAPLITQMRRRTATWVNISL
ncbi:MAG: hypothetical protein RMY64_02920 [Nostoc sp. DedQUE08]|nr:MULTISPECIES: hypothetical protein [unclassified Nostoc]MDZ8064581.1 hypothetical protein [Nostoc sp. DedQUE08]MDZ8092641.1 hypothetical protein [Nostoc sp. DedQUE05]